ncbi:DPOLN polymerase, partial [Eolophus roseicapillus]|nr:DPOLN polymerase [Eolophus roseicapilla]
DVRNLGCEEKRELLTTINQAAAFVATMIFQDGSSQLNSEQVLTSSVKGVVVLVKNQTGQPCPPSYSSTDCTWNAANKNDKLIYLRLEWPSLWEQAQQAHERFAGQVLFQMLRCKVPIICFNAKDFLRTLLQVYGNEISWKQGNYLIYALILEWTGKPAEAMNLLVISVCDVPFCESASLILSLSLYQNLGVNLQKLYNVMMDLARDLQVQCLWQLFCTLELPLLKILAVMETHKIHVNKHELKKTSEILGLRLKELEQEAHQVAGERFLVTSSSQLREVVLFEKLKLHTLCEKVHRTEIQQLVSTSEVVLKQLQDLHPLPKIILEYLDALLGCLRCSLCSFSCVLGMLFTTSYGLQHSIFELGFGTRVSIPFLGKQEEIITFSPRTLFVSKKGYTFLAADFSHIELRILADLSSEPELLKLFQVPETTDIFSTLASQWKGIPSDQVQHADREQAKRIVYSVVYGAGKEHLADCLGITPLQASQFIESFMQKYKKVHEFTKRTIEQCRNKGYVVSIMGRKRPLANINAQDYKLRTQAERQAVNFVVQG